jgi:hypothetical protein
MERRVDVHLVHEAAWWRWVAGVVTVPEDGRETVLYSTIAHRRVP